METSPNAVGVGEDPREDLPEERPMPRPVRLVAGGALVVLTAACTAAPSGSPPTSTATPTTTRSTTVSPVQPQAPTTGPSPTTATTTTKPSATTPTTTPTSTTTQTVLRRGDQGPAVVSVQQRLTELGYWLGPVDGTFGKLTEQAVYAVQKAAGLSRDGLLGPRTRAALDDGVRPAARSRQGRVVEVDLDRQLLLVVDDGRVRWILHTSTGTFEYYESQGRTLLADTPRGRWRIYRQVDGWHASPLGYLYKPKYFNEQGIAIHGYPVVPPYPASHGCVRVSIAAITWMWDEDLLPIGTPVWVY